MSNVEQADIKPVGIVADETQRGSFIKNMYNQPISTWKVREGFGRIHTFNTSYNAISLNASPTPDQFGYLEHLGSCGFITNWGHRQILSLWVASISTQARDGTDENTLNDSFYNDTKANPVSDHSNQYVVSIYDCETGRHTEAVITQKTSEIEDAIPMEAQYGFYDKDVFMPTNSKVYASEGKEQNFYWSELNDIVYFGTSELGLYAYRPVLFDAPPDVQTESTFLGFAYCHGGGIVGRNGWTETTFIEKAEAMEGLLKSQFVYLNRSEFPKPTDIAVINNRLAIAEDRTVYFSDQFNGASIIADNSIDLPTDKPITALSEINGVLLVFTEDETFLYQPSVGSEIQSSGRIIKLNSNWGCFNSQAKIKVEGKLYFTDASGIYVSDGNSIQDIGKAISPLFRRFLETPLTVYERAEEDGKSDLTQTQPKITYNWTNLKGLHFTKNPLNGLVFCVIPEQKFSLVIDADNQFTIWSWDTMDDDGTVADKTVKETSPFTNDYRMVDIGDNLFIIDLDEAQTIPAGEALFAEKAMRYASIYQWKVGGGVDASKSWHEDRKVYPAEGIVFTNPPGVNKHYQVVFGKPVAIYSGLYTDRATALYNTTPANQPWFLIPVGIACNRTLTAYTGPITSFDVEIQFDNTRWEVPTTTFPLDPTINYINLVFHPDRTASVLNFGWQNPAVGRQIALTAPNTITMQYDGTFAPTYFGRVLNVNDGVQPLFWLPVKLIDNTSDTLSFGWNVVRSTVNGFPGQGTYLFDFGSVHRDTTIGQYPIEWVLQSQAVQGEFGEVIKARGGFVSLLSVGPYPQASAVGAEASVDDRGLLNAMVASNYNTYQGQVVDWTQTPPSINDGLVQNATGLAFTRDISDGEFTDSTGALQPKVFGNTAAQYADLTADPIGGTILVDGEDYYDTSFSTSAKGTSFIITLYGYVQNIASKLLVKKFDAAYRTMSQARRRWKHDRGQQ